MVFVARYFSLAQDANFCQVFPADRNFLEMTILLIDLSFNFVTY